MGRYKHLGLIAGGSGLTPMLQIAQELLDRPDDNTKITMLFCSELPQRPQPFSPEGWFLIAHGL